MDRSGRGSSSEDDLVRDDSASAPTRTLPWAKPARERLLLVLIAIAVLSPVNVIAQGGPRVCLADAFLHGRLSADECLVPSFDKARFGGHLYSDKAPGISAVQVPLVAVFQPLHRTGWSSAARYWAVSVLSVGISLLVCTFLVGRVVEGLNPGSGGMTMVLFALGTLVFPLAAVNFGHVPGAALAFGSFLLAWRRRPGLAGAAAGAAVLVEYQAALAVVVIGAYVALAGRRSIARFIAAGVPFALLLGAYNWGAFGAPWHLSYRYVGNIYAADQKTGIFGIGVPHVFGIDRVFAGNSGLLVVSPVVMMAAYGLVLLGRAHRAEAVVAGVVTLVFVAANSSYFLPYGGGSPGPRFLVICLPFLALGLGPALSRFPTPTLILGAISLCGMTALSLVWGSESLLRNGIWGELARVPFDRGGSRFVTSLPASVLSFAGLGHGWGAGLVIAAVGLAFVIALRGMPSSRNPERAQRPSVASVLVFTAMAYLIVVANVFSMANYPYGVDPENPQRVSTSLSADSPMPTRRGDQLRVRAVAENGKYVGLSHVVLTFRLSPGLTLVEPPSYERGSGCVGTRVITCNLDSLSRSMATPVGLVVAVDSDDPQEITARTTADPDVSSNRASIKIEIQPAP